jgi:hypothetical protein
LSLEELYPGFFSNTAMIRLSTLLYKNGVEIPERTYHTLISLETGSVAYEIKAGPYTPLTAKDFAPWAPAEGNPEVENFMQSLLNKIDL